MGEVDTQPKPLRIGNQRMLLQITLTSHDFPLVEVRTLRPREIQHNLLEVT